MEIIWWNLFENCETFSGQIQSFESAQKTVKIKCKDFDNAAEFENLLINAIAEGKGPDIFSIKNTKVAKHRGKISPAPNSIFPAAEFKNTFFAVAADDLIFENKVYAAPLYIDTLALYFNKKVFRDNLPSSDRPAKTWEKLKEQVYGLTKKDNSIERFSLSGIALGRADNISLAVDILQLLFLQFQTQFYENKKAVFADQQGTFEGTGKAFYRGREALQLFTSFAIPSWKNYSWNLLITAFDGAKKEIGAFVRGKTAMIFGYSSLYENLKTEIEAAQKAQKTNLKISDIDIAPAPQLLDPAESGRQDSFANYYALAVSRNSSNAPTAWKFLKFLTSAQSLQDFHEKTHRPTSRKDMAETQISENLFGIFASQASFAKSLATYDDEDFYQIFKTAIDEVVKSKSSISDALNLAQKRMNCVLEKFFQKGSFDENCAEI